MATTDTQKEIARRGGRFAAITGRSITDCPYTKAQQPLLRLWFIRGYRSAESGKVIDAAG